MAFDYTNNYYIYNYDFYIKIYNYCFTFILSVAFFTLLERKVLSAMQRRRGPIL